MIEAAEKLYEWPQAGRISLGDNIRQFEMNRSSSDTLDTSSQISPVSPTFIVFSLKAMEDLQRELETCRREKKSMEEKLEVLAKHDTRPIFQRVFSDNDISIRVKTGRHPVFKVVFDKELYSVCWHGIDLGYSSYRDGLLEEVNQTLVFLWCAYAKAPSSDMTCSALKIRRLMLDFFEEV